jgi:hypothetical protein
MHQDDLSGLVKDQVYDRSGGQCECHSRHDGVDAPYHGGRCSVLLPEDSEPWYLHPVNGKESAAISNYQAICERCHEPV